MAIQEVTSSSNGVLPVRVGYFSLLLKHVPLWLSLTFLFTWTAVYIVPSFFSAAIPVADGTVVYPWMLSLVPFVVTFVIMGIVSSSLEYDFRNVRLLLVIALLADAGVALRWIAAASGGIWPNLAGAVLLGAVTPILYIEVVRQFLPLGFRAMFICSAMATVCSFPLMLLSAVAPHQTVYLCSLVLPVGIFLCLRHSIRGSSEPHVAPHPVDHKMYLPWKLLVTAVVQGAAFGSCQAFLSTCDKTVPSQAILVVQLLGFVAAVIALLIITRFLNFDFDLLMYKIGFTALAVGVFCICLLPSLLPGLFVACLGYRFIDVLMFTIVTFLAASKRVSLNWVSSLPTAMLYIGLAIGYLGFDGLVRSSATITDAWFLMCQVVILLLAAIMLISDRNVSGGWGSIRPGAEEGGDALYRQMAIEELCTRLGLSMRQRDVFKLLVEGKSRKEIAQDLFLSEETVKVHIRGVYQKSGVHSGKELFDLVNEEAQKLMQ